MSKINVNKSNKRVESFIKEKQVEVVKISFPFLSRSSKEILEKSKFFKNKGIKLKENTNPKNRQSYAQASAPKVNEILKLENFPNLSAKKIKNIYNNSGKIKSRINVTTKELFRRQIIILMSNDNKLKFLTSSNSHITNLNRALKNIKLDIMADFV